METIGLIVTLGSGSGTMNWVRPSCRRDPSPLRASTTMACARCAPLDHTLVPVSCQPPSTRTARQRTEARSEPESGSLNPIAKYASPAVMRGSHCARWASVPCRRIAGPIWRSANQCAATGAPAASSSSATATRSCALAPAPPNSTGSVIPTQPRAASRRENAGSNPVIQASLAGSNPPAASSSARNARTCARSAASAGRVLSAPSPSGPLLTGPALTGLSLIGPALTERGR